MTARNDDSPSGQFTPKKYKSVLSQVERYQEEAETADSGSESAFLISIVEKFSLTKLKIIYIITKDNY